MKVYTKNKGAGVTALRIVQKYHPEVTKVVDAKEHIVIHTTRRDDKNSIPKDHSRCAMAKACERQEHADGAIVSVKSAYIIRGKTAFRYRVPEAVAREVVSFDRKSGFEPGTYQLMAPSPSSQLGHYYAGPRRDRKPPRRLRMRHVTKNIRMSLLSKHLMAA